MTDGRAARDLPCSSQRFAAMCWWIHKCHENSSYRWWILDLWLWPRKKSPVITMEDWGLQGQKRPAKFRAKWKWCWQFLRPRKHCLPWVHARSTVLKFSFGCMMQCNTSDLHHRSEVTGSCTMTTPPPTHPTLFRTSWLNIRNHRCHSPPPIHQTWLCECFFCSQRWKCWNAVEEEQVSRHVGGSMKCNNAAVGYSKESVPKVL